MVKRIVRKLARILFLTDVIQKTSWWKERYAHTNDFKPQPLFRADYQRNYEAIALGSDTAANDYEFGGGVAGLNLSTGYQPLCIDDKILSFYHSYLRSGGFVLINLNPFSLFHQRKLNADYFSRFIKPLPLKDKQKFGDYYSSNIQLLDSTQLPTDVYKYMEYPMLYEPMHCLKALLGGGKLQFAKKINQLGFTSSDGEILSKMILFCKSRNYRPVVVITPMPHEFSNRINDDNWAQMEEQIKGCFAPDNFYILNYARQKRWQASNLYANALYLKADVKNEFTQQVMTDTKKLYGTVSVIQRPDDTSRRNGNMAPQRATDGACNAGCS